MSKTSTQAGFTLVELSIVLVIIGLIIAGIIFGADMIKNSEIRAAIGQFEKYNAAVNTFRGKFGGLPGDLKASMASGSGLTTLGGGPGLSDGDGIIEGSGGVTGSATTGAGESTLFWKHLTEAAMIDSSLDGSQTNGAKGATFPLLKLRQAGIAAFSDTGRQYFQIGAISSTAGGPIVTANAITPYEAYIMDQKMDDGTPGGGQVQAMGGTVISTATSSFTAADCTDGATGNYNRTLTTVVCQLRLPMN